MRAPTRSTAPRASSRSRRTPRSGRSTLSSRARKRRSSRSRRRRWPGLLMSAKYVAIITDGNGRWARQRDLPVVEGHRAGADVVKERLRDAAELGIEELTVYSFSTENWSRSDEEVEGLMRMFGERIASETPELEQEGVRMRFVGRREGVEPGLVERMEWAEAQTAGNDRITLFVAF